jgi:hypothetical protein
LAFTELDVRAVARTLARLAAAEAKVADAFFERREVLELPRPGCVPGVRLWREEGLALRLSEGMRSWVASRDGVDNDRYATAYRQVARRPIERAPLGDFALRLGGWPEPPPPEPLLELPHALERLLRQSGAAFPFQLLARRHRRWVQVVGDRVTPPAQEEGFFSLAVDHPAGRYGCLLTQLESAQLAGVAQALVEQVQARNAEPPHAGRTSVVLGAAATAVFLHEAVAHSLEADTLALAGDPERAVGAPIAARSLSLLDDPSAAPDGVRRSADDEGMAVVRRWLLRDGVVEQPLADLAFSSAGRLEPGAGWRADRHHPASPRTYHLELLAGEASREELLAGVGLYVARIERGLLDPVRGRVTLHVPGARVFSAGELGARVGPFVVRGTVTALLHSVEAVGRDRQVAGAGWCAKGGAKVPVWASTPALRLERVEVGRA